MRIGILTLPFNNNYGGYLQAYALLTILKNLGHHPSIIMRRHNKPQVTFGFKLKYLFKGLAKTILRFTRYPIMWDVENDFLHKGKNMLKFVNKNIQPQTPYLYTTEELREYCNDKYDAFIVGSDQVWRAIYVSDIKNFFLDFTEGWNVKRVAYAASFGTGTPEYTEEQKQQCEKLIKQFNAVSFREKSGITVLENFGWNIPVEGVVLDPTLLLTSNDYCKLLPSQKSISNGLIFYYVLDRTPNIDMVLSELSNYFGMGTYGIANIQKKDNTLASIEEWMMNIRDADFVVTDSFHGMVFSIIFHKPFVVTVNVERGADRFISLLSLLGLYSRIITDGNPIDKIMREQINWEIIDRNIIKLKDKSITFLKEKLQ